MFEKVSILIIEDDDEIREMIRDKILEEIPGAKCFESKDGKDGLQKISMQKFDLVITDLGLPKIDGRTLIQECEHVHKDMKPGRFIVISGETNQDAFPSKFGKVEFFPKPFKWDQLINSIKNPDAGNAKKPSGTVDIEFINPFIDSALNVLEVTAGTKAVRNKVALKAANQACVGDISSIISMNSEIYLGSMAISFEEKCFLAIVNSMLGETYTAINDENRDAASELCNQIFGRAKKILNEKGHSIQPAIPTVITGKAHQITHSASGPIIVVEFTTDNGAFTIEAVTEKRST